MIEPDSLTDLPLIKHSVYGSMRRSIEDYQDVEELL